MSTIIAIAIGATVASILLLGLSMLYAKRDSLTIARQHVADLERRLSNLLDEKSAIELEIDATTHRLMVANLNKDATFNHQTTPRAGDDWIDRDLNNVIPHSY